jgi:hypothetical protein
LLQIPLIDNKNVLDTTVDQIIARIWKMMEWLACHRQDKFREMGIDIPSEYLEELDVELSCEEDKLYLNELYK